MRTADRVVRKTVSVEVRKRVRPVLRARNFTRGSVWPMFGAKVNGNAFKAWLAPAACACATPPSIDSRIAEASARRALDLMVVSFGRDGGVEVSSRSNGGRIVAHSRGGSQRPSREGSRRASGNYAEAVFTSRSALASLGSDAPC